MIRAIRRFVKWYRTPWYKRTSRLDRIAEDMYYDQAGRDGCEYPPQWRG